MSRYSRIASIWPDPVRLKEHGLDVGLGKVPSLVWAGHRASPAEIFHAAREFLEKRAGISTPSITYHETLKPKRFLHDSPETTKKVAGALSNFFDYCVRSRTSWRDIQVGHKCDKPSVLHWAYASLEGSSGQSAVSANTVSIRFYYVQHFLWWAGTNGYRRPYEPSPHAFTRGVRPKDRLEDLIGIPEEEEVQRWLKQIQKDFDRQAYLMIRLGLEVGLRSSETRYLRAARIPKKSVLIDGGDSTTMGILGDPSMEIFQIGIGAEDRTKYGKPRTIWIPKDLMVALQAWMRVKSQRLHALELFSRKYPRLAKPTQIFFNPQTGRPWGKNHVNDDIIKKTELVDGLGTTHKLRHYFASRFMLRHTVRALRIGQTVSKKNAGFLLDSALSEAELQLQLQLGHSHGSTTMVYRKWAREQVLLNGYR